MYRLLALAVAMLLAITLSACGDEEATTTPETTRPEQTTTAPTEPSEPDPERHGDGRLGGRHPQPDWH
jgi:hypothetical protein